MSAETKWTKGTWALVIRPRGPDEIRSSDERAELICEFPFGASDGSELEASAHLIAAAPDLYEALESLVDEVTNHGEADGAILDSARAALTKARGEA
jgi:hypothetical protein